MRWRACTLVVAAVWCLVPPGVAQSPPPSNASQAGVSREDTCSRLDAAIDLSLKFIAQADADGVGDNSAPRATLAELKINNELLLITNNLQLRRDNGCPPLKEPISTARYFSAALKCGTELLELRLGKPVVKREGSSLPLSCDMDTWQPTVPGSGTSEPAAKPQ